MYVLQQVIASAGILVAYGALGLHRNGKWLDALYGLLYSVSSFILFGVIDSFHHTFIFGVKLMVEQIRLKIKSIAGSVAEDAAIPIPSQEVHTTNYNNQK
jgi:hypothetical protein